MKRLARYFLNGLLLIVPLSITGYVCVRIVRAMDSLVGSTIPGAGLAAAVVLITVVGALMSNLLARSLLTVVDRVMKRLPIVRLLYTSLQDVMGAFVGEKRRFDKPVMVTLLPESGIKVVGFLTQESLGRLGGPGEVAVYLPQSYNFAGQTLVVPASRVTRIEASSTEVMAFIVSGGISASSTTTSAAAAGSGS